MTDIADELATLAGLDPAWDAVLAAYLDGAARYPEPFTARNATPPHDRCASGG
jgi:hypothetical protein